MRTTTQALLVTLALFADFVPGAIGGALGRGGGGNSPRARSRRARVTGLPGATWSTGTPWLTELATAS